KSPVTREQIRALIDRQTGDLDKRREALVKLRERLDKAKGDEELPAIQAAIFRESRGFTRDGRDQGGNSGSNQGGKPPGAERAEMMELLHQTNPGLAARMAEFAKGYPGASGLIERLGVKPADFVRAKTEDPALFDLYAKQIDGAMSVAQHVNAVSGLIAQGKGDSDEGKARRIELREAVAKHFETRAAIQSRDIESLKVRLERLQKQFGEQASNREQAIDRWVAELIKKGSELGRSPERRPNAERPNAEKPKVERPNAERPSPEKPK
ncbi:MAG: hypothetical protein AABZ53_04430, partial [Planctomycetota bacterium]